jgi:chemosensory pili system protein ChpC
MDQQTVRAFLLPFKSGYALLPHSSMVEVLPFATPLTLENAPSWVVGTMLWRALDVPLVALENLALNTQPRLDSHTRIVMINTLNTHANFNYIGLLGTDAPRLININYDEITRIDPPSEFTGSGVLSWTQVKDHMAIIPDMDVIEATLNPLMQHN